MSPVSGDRVVLAGDVDGAAERLVRTVAQLGDLDLGRYALVGGLAVMSRLAAVHRATQDIDTVTETGEPSAVEVIASNLGTIDPTNPNRVVVDGVKIDVITTDSFEYDDLDGVDPDGRLFVVSHRWALETADDTEIVAGTTTARIRISTVASLVAMKAGAISGGRRREPHKRASDLHDLYRLVLHHDRSGAVTDALAVAPYGLGLLVGDALRSGVTDEPERAARSIRSGGPETHSVGPDALIDVLGPLVAQLTR